MGIKYSRKFKETAVKLLNGFNREGVIYINKKKITNVAGLVNELGISKWSLYYWRDNVPNIEGYLTDYNKVGIKPKEIKEKDWDIIPSDDVLIVKSELRFWGFLASLLNVKGYSHMTPNQLQLRIGVELIKRSGLVDMDKAIKEINGGK